MSNSINTRISLKHDTETNWVAKTTFVPRIGEVIIYDNIGSSTSSRIKIGDGTTNINTLPFFGKGVFVEAQSGKGLSSNDYTTTDKNRVATLTDDYINSLIDTYFSTMPMAEETKY